MVPERTGRLSRAQLQRMQRFRNPGFDLVQPMVTFRQDERQSHSQRPAQTGAVPIAMRRKVVIQQLRKPHLLGLRKQARYVVHSFCRYGKLFCHSDGLPSFRNSVEIGPNRESVFVDQISVPIQVEPALPAGANQVINPSAETKLHYPRMESHRMISSH